MLFFLIKECLFLLDLFFLSSLQWRSVKSLTLHTSRKTTKWMGRNGLESFISVILHQETHSSYLQALVLFCILIWSFIWFCLLFFTEGRGWGKRTVFSISAQRKEVRIWALWVYTTEPASSRCRASLRCWNHRNAEVRRGISRNENHVGFSSDWHLRSSLKRALSFCHSWYHCRMLFFLII